jgi:hypothetical protein
MYTFNAGLKRFGTTRPERAGSPRDEHDSRGKDFTHSPAWRGRRLKNDTESLKKLFDLHTKMGAELVPQSVAPVSVAQAT